MIGGKKHAGHCFIKRGYTSWEKSYIQSGNLILNTDLTLEKTRTKIHEIIKEKIGADLSIIIKTKEDFNKAISQNPFDERYDYSRIHLVFTESELEDEKIKAVTEMEFGSELFEIGESCFYMYLPRDAEKKKLNTNFLEKKLGITATMRKINVVQKLYDIAREI